MPIESFPEIAFIIIVCIYFISTDFILKVVSVMSVYTNLSQIFVGLTVMSWGSSAIELINMTIAVKKNEM
jgi:Ca2+/Na+ antiporter